METLDLHGKRYFEVEILVQDFLAVNEFPVRIITGQSPTMKAKLFEVLDELELEVRWQYESDWNLGSIILMRS